MKKYQFILFGAIIMFFNIISIHAASFHLSSSTNQIAPNKTFTIKVGGDCIGRVDLKVSNGTLSTNSVWVEQGYINVNVTAGSKGSVVVTATPVAGFSDADANLYNPGSRSITVAITSTTSSKPNTTSPTVQKSSDNNLSSLTPSTSQLSPSFQSSQTEYSLNLPANISSLNLKATASSMKAKVEGIGNIAVKPGNNIIKITVTAENGSKKIYTIKAYVDDTPQIYLNYQNQKIGIIRNLEGITIPTSFTQSNHPINEQSIFLFTNEKLNIIYGINEEKEKNFYLFDKETNEIIHQFIPININNHIIYNIDTASSRKNTILKPITINNQKINCYQLKQEENNYCLLNAINKEGNKIEYLYESSENTIQLYPEFLTKCEVKEKSNNTIIYILTGLLFLTFSMLLFSLFKQKKGDSHEKTK